MVLSFCVINVEPVFYCISCRKLLFATTASSVNILLFRISSFLTMHFGCSIWEQFIRSYVNLLSRLFMYMGQQPKTKVVAEPVLDFISSTIGCDLLLIVISWKHMSENQLLYCRQLVWTEFYCRWARTYHAFINSNIVEPVSYYFIVWYE